jgi:DNA-directed RNA polymerase specialized sigma24 family protein
VDDQVAIEREPAEFAAFAAARLPALVAYGYVLSGDRHDAQDLAQEALARAGTATFRLSRGGCRDMPTSTWLVFKNGRGLATAVVTTRDGGYVSSLDRLCS